MKIKFPAITLILVLSWLVFGFSTALVPLQAEDDCVDLVVVPDTLEVNPGESFTITVEARCGSQSTDGMDLFLEFDPDFLAVQSAEAGTALSTVLTPAGWDNTTGTFVFGAGQLSAPFPSGTFTVINITLQALNNPTAATAVNFSTSVDNITAVDWEGDDVTGSLTGGLFTIKNVEPVLTSIDVGWV